MKTIYYVAISLDGFIAKSNGDISWLSCIEVSGEDYGYENFYNSVEVILMGRKTYELCSSFPEWPYSGKRTIVFSESRNSEINSLVEITNQPPKDIINQLESEGISTAWIVGGGKLAGTFAKANLIDEYIISIVPVILSEGVKLIQSSAIEKRLKLTGVKTYPSGLVQVTYRKDVNR